MNNEERLSKLEQYCAVNDEHWIRHDENAQAFRNEIKLIMANMEKTIENRLEIMNLGIDGLSKSFSKYVKDNMPIIEKVKKWEAQMTGMMLAYAGIAALITFVTSNWAAWFK